MATTKTTLPFPSSKEVRAKLGKLSPDLLTQLASSSRVPLSTLTKIKRGDTQNPGIETVGAFWPHLLKLTAA